MPLFRIRIPAPPVLRPMFDKLLLNRARSGRFRLFVLSLFGALVPGLMVVLPVQSTVSDRIVAVVNTEVITQTELEEEVNDLKGQARLRFTGRELNQRLRQIDFMGINRMIERKWQIHIAKRRGINVTDA